MTDGDSELPQKELNQINSMRDYFNTILFIGYGKEDFSVLNEMSR